LQQEQPQLYETLTTNLNSDEQTIVQGVVHQAEANAAAAAAALQAPGVVINGAT
jgi:importin-7